MFYRHRFESEIYPTLSRIPLHVRMKLDLVGLKISLKHWLAFSFEERTALCHLPAETEEERNAFSGYLDFLLIRYEGEKVVAATPIGEALWEETRVPESVLARGTENRQPVTLEEWRQWDPYRRYALYKLSITKNEPAQFNEALKEFRGHDKGSEV